MLRIAFALALLWPAVGSAVPIPTIGDPIYGVAGWSNHRGNFTVDRTPDSDLSGAPDSGIASYSTASLLFSFSAIGISDTSIQTVLHSFLGSQTFGSMRLSRTMAPPPAISSREL